MLLIFVICKDNYFSAALYIYNHCDTFFNFRNVFLYSEHMTHTGLISHHIAHVEIDECITRS